MMHEYIQYNDPECEYSLFISYSYADDKAEDGWVRSLKNAIFQRFDKLSTNVPRKPIYFSGDEAPGSGETLGVHLEDRVRRSFAMLLVVGKQYVNSSYCEDELKLFRKHFGDQHKGRLYIAVMGEAYLLRVREGATWRQIVAPDHLWTAMYRDQLSDRPMEHRLRTGEQGFPPDFRDAAYAIADRLCKEIDNDWTQSAASSSVVAPPTSDILKSPLLPTASQDRALRVVIGPFTESFDAHAGRQPIALLQQTLEQASANVQYIERNELTKYRPSSGKPIRGMLEKADVLIVPVIDETPLLPDVPGGHATILAKEWAALQRPKSSLVWYRPPPSEVCPDDSPEPEHAEVFRRLAPICPSPQAAVNLLFGAGASDVIRVYIEKHPAVSIFALSELIEKAWTDLHGGSCSKAPRLKCVPLMLDQLDDVPKDVAAVVLLHANGHTPLKSLRQRETEVEKLFPRSTPVYPGLVAVVMRPPPTQPHPSHEWGDVTLLIDDKKPPDLQLDPGSAVWLVDFLNLMWKQYQKGAASLH